MIGKNLKTVLKLWPLYLFLIGYFSFALFTFKDFGISKDEPNYYRQGTILKEYFLGHRLPQNIENSEDNPLLNQTYLVYEAFLSLLNPTGSYEIYHLLNLLFSSLIFIFAYVVLYQKYKDAKLALLGPLFIFFSGRFLGLIPFDPPNVTFAVMFFVSLCLLYLTDHFRNKFFNSIFFKGILLGIMFGLTIALNFMGIILYLLYLLQVFYNLFYSFKETQNSSKIKYLKYAGLQFLIVLFTGTFLMIATWPYLGSNPLAHFSELFVKYINPMGYGNLTYYLGQLQSSLILPWHYLFVWLGLTLPIVILVLYLVSLVFSFKKFSDDLFFLNFFAILITFIIYFAIKFPNIQGLGPFLFLVPLICLQAALVIVETLYQAKNVLYKQVLITIFALSFATVAFNLYKLHPYEYLYFNELSGDLRSASRNFEIDYLQTTNKEVSQKIIDDIIHNNLENPQVYACGEKEALKYFGRGIYTITEKTSEADYLVCPANQFELEPTFQLVKEGVILNNITKIHHQY